MVKHSAAIMHNVIEYTARMYSCASHGAYDWGAAPYIGRHMYDATAANSSILLFVGWVAQPNTVCLDIIITFPHTTISRPHQKEVVSMHRMVKHSAAINHAQYYRIYSTRNTNRCARGGGTPYSACWY